MKHRTGLPKQNFECEHLNIAVNEELSMIEKAMLQVILLHHKDYNLKEYFPILNRDLTDKVRVSLPTLTRYRKRLFEKGYFKISKTKHGKPNSLVYRLNFQKLISKGFITEHESN